MAGTHGSCYGSQVSSFMAMARNIEEGMYCVSQKRNEDKNDVLEMSGATRGVEGVITRMGGTLVHSELPKLGEEEFVSR